MIKKIIIFFFILIGFSVSALASASGPAAVYKVTMRKVELCTSSTSVTNCANSVVIGTGDKVVDIASVGSGSVAASYGDPALLPLGETYTHMRVTVDRKFVMKSGSVLDPAGDAEGCVTRATSDTLYGGTEAARKYTHNISHADDKTIGDAQEMNIYLVNDSYTQCENANCSSNSAATNDYSSPSKSLFQSTHDSDTSDDHMLVYQLTSPYTVALISPTIDISFGTSEALGAFTAANGQCAFNAGEPVVTITIR
ncbi:hypothetical protein N9U18_00945 [Candidatus Pelagibacter sp.]|nr:hypothetical protein [Candidatus Pelagibacter sp.]MDA9709211.1 hypothetical protein [Candidatus Pelagibacter sp.]